MNTQKHNHAWCTIIICNYALHLSLLTHSAIVSTNSAVVVKSLGGIVLVPPSADGSKAAFKLSDIFWITIL